MDKVTELVIGLVGTLSLVGLIMSIVWGTDNGGWIHGKWINKSHDCHRPSYFDGKDGDQWQCHRCKKVWNYKNHEWE